MTGAKDKEIVFYAVGDVGPNREDPQSMFRHVSGLLKHGDIRFCQLETNLSTRGKPLPQARLPMRVHPNSARALSEAGFQVISFASNHCMDFGQEAFFDTHHPHILKGIEVYKGKTIMYSLGNFAIEQPAAFMKGLFKTGRHKEIEKLNPQWDEKHEYPLPPETRNSLIVKCVISGKRIQRISFLPAYITDQSEPEILKSDDERFEDVIRYVGEITSNQGIYTRFAREGDEVIIETD